MVTWTRSSGSPAPAGYRVRFTAGDQSEIREVVTSMSSLNSVGYKNRKPFPLNNQPDSAQLRSKPLAGSRSLVNVTLASQQQKNITNNPYGNIRDSVNSLSSDQENNELNLNQMLKGPGGNNSKKKIMTLDSNNR